jgi:hypothetical protein
MCAFSDRKRRLRSIQKARHIEAASACGGSIDLFIDYTRWNYFKGSITYLNPRKLGLQEFPEEGVFVDFFAEYYQQIINTYNRQYLRQLRKAERGLRDVHTA